MEFGIERKTGSKGSREDRDMSRQIPIFVEPGYETTFHESRRSSDPMGDDTRHHHRQHRLNDTGRIEEEFDDASNRFFEKNFRRRHTDFPDSTYFERDFKSHSPPRYQERPFRRGSNPSDLPFGNPSWRRGHFDEMIQRMMREDSDSFDFSDPEFGNFHVERTTGKRHSPEDTRKKHEKVTKSPSAPVSGERYKGKFDRQSSSPSTGSTVGDEGFVDIPVVVCKDDKVEEKVGKNEREKPGNGVTKIGCVTQENTKAEVNSESTENEKVDKERESEDDSELTIKISVDTTDEKGDKNEEGTAKIDEKNDKKAVQSQENVESEKSTSEQKIEEQNQMPQESQQNAEIPQESQQNAEMPQESQQNAQLSKIKKIEDELKVVAEKVKVFEPNGSTENNKEYLWLEEQLMRILMGLDAIEANGNKEIRGARKAVVKRVQVALNELEKKSAKNVKS